MATSLDDETQQASFREAFPPSSQLAKSPAPPSLTRSKKRLVSSSPVPEESAGGFMEHQVSTEIGVPDNEANVGERESVNDRGKQAVDSGNLLRVNTGTAGPFRSGPQWNTQPVSTPGAGPSSTSSRLSAQKEEDELDPSSPVPPQPEEEPPSVESPGTASPPLFEQTDPATRTRKRKTPPSPPKPTSPATPASALKDKRNGIFTKPVSAHSPAKLILTKSNATNIAPTIPAPASAPAPARQWTRTNSRLRPGQSKQKKAIVEQDSFAEPAPTRKERASVTLNRLLSGGGLQGDGALETPLEVPLEVPLEMRGTGMEEEDWASTEDGHMGSEAEADVEEDNFAGRSRMSGQDEPSSSARPDEELDAEEVDEVEGSVGHDAPSGNVGVEKVPDNLAGRIDHEQSGTLSRVPDGDSAVSADASGPGVSASVKVKDFVLESSVSSSREADVTTESVLFTPAGPTRIVQEEDSQTGSARATERDILSPLRPPTSSLPFQPPSSPLVSLAREAQNVPFGESVFGRNMRGFTNVAMSQTMPDDAHAEPDRHDLFSSQGDAAGLSQVSDPQSQGWSNFQPTQVRRQAVHSDGPASSTEPTQIVSEESHERARQVRAARMREEDGGEPGEAGGEDMARVATETSSLGFTAEGERPAARISPAETFEPTYQTRRSNDEPTQINSEATQLRSAASRPANNGWGTGSTRSPERVSEPPPNIMIAEHRQLRRRNLGHTRSAPQPALFVSARMEEGDQAAHTDPIPDGHRQVLPDIPAVQEGKVDEIGKQVVRTEPEDPSVETGSPPPPPERSSSMQETEDMLHLAARTQATQRSQKRSVSPMITVHNTRGLKRRIMSSSPVQSPEQPLRKSSPIAFPDSDLQGGVNPTLNPGPTVDPVRAIYEPTLLNGETVPTLPKSKPAKIPTPVKTYGTRGKTNTVSPAEPPPTRTTRGRAADNKRPATASPEPQIAPGRRLVKRQKREASPEAEEIDMPSGPTHEGEEGDVAVSTGGSAVSQAANPEIQAGSSRPFRRPIDADQGSIPKDADRTEADAVEPPEPESPPTPQDPDDNTYQPVRGGIGGGKPKRVTTRGKGKTEHVGPPSEEGVESDSDADDGALEEGAGLKGRKKLDRGTRTSLRKKSNQAKKVTREKRPARTRQPPSEKGAEDTRDESKDAEDEDDDIVEEGGSTDEPGDRAQAGGPTAQASNATARAGKEGKKPIKADKRGERRRIASPEGLGDSRDQTDGEDVGVLPTGKGSIVASRSGSHNPLPSSRLSSRHIRPGSGTDGTASPSGMTSTMPVRKAGPQVDAAESGRSSRSTSNANPSPAIQAINRKSGGEPVPSAPRQPIRMRRTRTPDQAEHANDEPPEPESPPTPVDQTDETFRPDTRKSKGLPVPKNGPSRQPSVASTSRSAGPSKTKTSAEPIARKGRTSKLSVADDAASHTPTSQIPANGDAGEDGPMVLAYFKSMQSFYPGKVVAQVGSAYRIRYLDDDEAIVPLTDMRQCKFLTGDRIKCDAAGMARKVDLEVAADWDGEGKISLRDKKGDSVGEFDLDVIRVARATLVKRFDDRQVTVDMFQGVPEEEGEDAESDSGEAIGSGSRIKGTNAFADKVFLITPTDSTTESLRNAITRNAGILLDWLDLFDKLEFGQPPKGPSGRIPLHITTTEIESGKASMKVKSMIALCFGIPCISPAFVDAALVDPDCDWRPYAISPGVGMLHPSPTLQWIDPAWGTSDWSFSDARHQLRPLAGQRVVYLHLNSKMVELTNIVPVCAFGLGAVSCEVIKTPDDINDAAAAAYDILVLSSAETDGKKASALPKVISGNKRVCDVQWLKQCMISGVCLPLKLYSYTI